MEIVHNNRDLKNSNAVELINHQFLSFETRGNILQTKQPICERGLWTTMSPECVDGKRRLVEASMEQCAASAFASTCHFSGNNLPDSGMLMEVEMHQTQIHWSRSLCNLTRSFTQGALQKLLIKPSTRNLSRGLIVWSSQLTLLSRRPVAEETGK